MKLRAGPFRLHFWCDPELYLAFEISKRRGSASLDIALCVLGLYCELQIGFGEQHVVE